MEGITGFPDYEISAIIDCEIIKKIYNNDS